MNYVLQCEKYDRPASIVSRKIGRQRTGHETVKKTVPSKCDCGGKIVPTIE